MEGINESLKFLKKINKTNKEWNEKHRSYAFFLEFFYMSLIS